MSDIQLGQLISGPAVRDAVHIAIAPVIAGQDLKPGEHVQLIIKGENIVIKGDSPIGIVDPLLKKKVKVGQEFYLWMYPNTITSLRHDWTHPDFLPKTPKEDSEIAVAKAWIESFAIDNDSYYDEIMEAAENYLRYNDYLSDGGRFEGCRVTDEFWDHYSIIVGYKVDENNRGSFFSCSC